MKWLLTLVTSKDGSLSQTKLAAACFHFAIFCAVCLVTWIKREWITEMWLTYGAFAVGHAGYDKTMANVRAFKEKKLEVEAGGESMTTTTTIKSGEPPRA